MAVDLTMYSQACGLAKNGLPASTAPETFAFSKVLFKTNLGKHRNLKTITTKTRKELLFALNWAFLSATFSHLSSLSGILKTFYIISQVWWPVISCLDSLTLSQTVVATLSPSNSLLLWREHWVQSQELVSLPLLFTGWMTLDMCCSLPTFLVCKPRGLS